MLFLMYSLTCALKDTMAVIPWLTRTLAIALKYNEISIWGLGWSSFYSNFELELFRNNTNHDNDDCDSPSLVLYVLSHRVLFFFGFICVLWHVSGIAVCPMY